ncbi:hypothetical protein BKA93DRAFT_785048 [Sparassis latifolia]
MSAASASLLNIDVVIRRLYRDSRKPGGCTKDSSVTRTWRTTAEEISSSGSLLKLRQLHLLWSLDRYAEKRVPFVKEIAADLLRACCAEVGTDALDHAGPWGNFPIYHRRCTFLPSC